MSTEDFRYLSEFREQSVAQSGRIVGSRSYWKLYAIENIWRVIICSVLSVEHPTKDWWNEIFGERKLRLIAKWKEDEKNLGWRSTRGDHVIYYLNLDDLKTIIDAVGGLFIPLINDIEDWGEELRDVAPPRNVVAHMNFPTSDDKRRVDDLYAKTISLVRELKRNARVKLIAPR